MQPGDILRPGSSNDGGSSNKDEGAAMAPQNLTEPVQAQGWYRPETDAPGFSPAPVSTSMPPEQVSHAGETDHGTGVKWTASEFIAHDKPAAWFIAFVFVALLIAAGTYFLTREIITVVAVVGALGAFGAMATRHPRVLEYELTDRGVRIAEKLYPYTSFKSFSLFDDGALHAIDLIPMERFRPLVTVYFPPEQEAQILEKLGDSLAYEQRTPDLVDRLMHRLRF